MLLPLGGDHDAGTPNALFVDAHGKVASAVVVGAPAVLALTRGEPEQARATAR